MQTRFFSRALLLGSLTLFAAVSAIQGCTCGDDLNRIDEPEPDPPGDDTLPIDDVDPDPPPPPADPVWTLEYEGADPTVLYFGGSADVAFLLTDEEGQPVTFEAVVLQVTGTAGTLAATELLTDASGRAATTFEAGPVPGTVDVVARAQWTVEDAEAHLVVQEDPAAGLEVHVSSTTRIAVERSDLLVAVGPSGSLGSCTDALGGLLTPTFVETLTTLPDVRVYPSEESGSDAVAVAFGYGPTGALIASGCTKVADLGGGLTTSVEVVLEQHATVLDGDYDVLMSVALGQALPEPYESTVDFITGLLADPAGYAVYRALEALDDDTGTSFVHRTDMNGDVVLVSFDDVMDNPAGFPTWNLARNFLHDQLVAELGQDYIDVTTVGGDLRDAVTDFEVGARFSLTLDPDLGPDRYAVVEQWNDLVFEWSRGCTPGDLSCIRRAVELEDTAYAPVVSEYEAVAEHAPTPEESERFYVRTYPHSLGLKYGAILLIILDELLYPELGADSLAGFFINLIDCEGVGEALADAIGGLPILYEGFCATGMTLAAQQIEEQLLSLEVGGNPDLSGAAGESWLYLVDAYHELQTSEMPELHYEVAWQDPNNPDLADEVAAPIFGQGREAASMCASDLECSSLESCQPVPHYLWVSQLEMDCRPLVGSLVGGAACSADGDCASGLCNAGFCYAACSSDDVCSGGSCAVQGLAIDLDPLLVGLGDVWAPSCVQ